MLEVLRQSVHPEFLNRIDEIIMFDPLTKAILDGTVRRDSVISVDASGGEVLLKNE